MFLLPKVPTICRKHSHDTSPPTSIGSLQPQRACRQLQLPFCFSKGNPPLTGCCIEVLSKFRWCTARTHARAHTHTHTHTHTHKFQRFHNAATGENLLWKQVSSRPMVFNLGYEYPRGLAKTFYGVHKIKIRPRIASNKLNRLTKRSELHS
jgi:hypothetical protein